MTGQDQAVSGRDGQDSARQVGSGHRQLRGRVEKHRTGGATNGCSVPDRAEQDLAGPGMVSKTGQGRRKGRSRECRAKLGRP